MIVRIFGPVVALYLLTCVMMTGRRIHGQGLESECRSNLRGWLTAQRVFRQELGSYANDVGPVFERGNRYLYAWGTVGRLAGPRDQPWGVLPEAGKAHPVPRHLIPTVVRGGLAVGVTADVATAVCVAQLDDDDEVDVWSVSTAERSAARGDRIRAGDVFHERADRNEGW